MQASETKLKDLIGRDIQYVVPLFQRPYSWSEKQWKILWIDILDQSRHEDGRPHFFGSIVTAPAKSVPQGVSKYLLIDGQQRLTTVQLLLVAVRDSADGKGDVELREKIDDLFLTNRHQKGDDRLKVLPTQADRDAFRAIIQHKPIPESPLRLCYQFFLARLDRLSAQQLDLIQIAAVDRLSIVSITCDEHDNPHLIFESLNAKGEKLTPADLIRNFLLMRVKVQDQDRLHQEYWQPIEKPLAHQLTEFVRHYLMKEGRILKEADVYFELKERLTNATPSQVEDFLRDLHRHGLFYASFIDSTREADPDIAERLDRVRRLKVTVAYPMLLRVFDAYQAGHLDKGQVLETLDILESFVIRRSICNYQTNQLRRMLPPVFDVVGGPGETFVDGVRKQLGGNRCPDDEKFMSSLATEKLYANAEKNARLRLILERIERSFEHKEPAELGKAQIEHVLPQTMTPEWNQEIGEGAEEEALGLLHSLGNLTLTSYNSELSNKPFKVKQSEFRSSHFVLNRYFAEVTSWTPEAIRRRGLELAKRSLEIWPDVSRATTILTQERKQTSPPIKIRFRDQYETVKTWKEAYLKLLKHFDMNNPRLLNRIASEGSLYTAITMDSEKFRKRVDKIGEIYLNIDATAATFQNWCRKVAEIGGYELAEYEFVTRDESSRESRIQ